MRLETGPRRRNVLALTSLVDVVFILLFFFMLAAQPPAARHLELQLASTVDRATAAPSPALVMQGARVRWAGRTWVLPDLIGALRAERTSEIELGADPTATLQDLLHAFDALRAEGIRVRIMAAQT